MAEKTTYQGIPVDLTQQQFDQFFCDHLSSSSRGRKTKISNFRFLRYILKVLYTGMQWMSLPIEKDDSGKPEIHYTNVYRRFKIWSDDGSLAHVFESSVCLLQENGLLDTSIVHGDGSSTAAKKGGDNLGYNGHKHHKGEKVVAITDRNANIISPFVVAPGHRNEVVLLKESLDQFSRVARLAGIDFKGSVMSLDGGYDSVANRKYIFNRGMIPNIKENKRNRKSPKRGRKRIYDEEIFQERFRTVERAFAWEDKFKRLLLRFERISSNHFGMKLLAFSLINLRHFC
jgi:transposase